MILKKLRNFIYSKKYTSKFLVITILGIKISVKPFTFKHRYHIEKIKNKKLNESFNNYYNDVKFKEKYAEEGFYSFFKNNNIHYNEIIKDKPYISVIIIVYNVGEKYLSICIESVLNQSLKEIEIIIFNNNSPLQEDNITLERYSNMDKRIKYIFSEKNLSYGEALKEALKYSAGFSVTFLDANDYLYKMAYETCLFSLLYYNVDIVAFGYKYGNEQIFLGNSIFYDDLVLKSLFSDIPKTSLYNKLFVNKTEYVNFTTDITSLENLSATLYFFERAKSLFIIPQTLYEHRYIEKDLYFYNNEKNYIRDSMLIYNYIFNNYGHYDISEIYSVSIINLYYKIVQLSDKNKVESLKIYLFKLIYNNFKRNHNHLLSIDAILNKLKKNTGNDKNIIKWYTENFIKRFYRDELKKFINADLNEERVLITELNGCHGEVLPGITKYFLDLGYKVDILVSHYICQDGALDIFNNNNNIRIFCIHNKYYIFKALKNKKIKRYYVLFITSWYLYYTSDNWPCVEDYIKNIQKQNKKIIVLEHHLDLANNKLLRENKIAVMHNLDNNKFPIDINPHYFGDVKITQKNEDITKFIMVGAIESHRKNSNLIIESLKSLLNDGYKNFHLTVIGRGKLSSDLYSLNDFIDIKGRVSYPKLYEEMESSDFILPMLDPDNKEHERYLKYGVSGSIQLIYGFGKICIINRKFASVYGFNDSNSVIYDRNEDLPNALKRAIAMSNQEYMEKQNNLKKYANNLYMQSLDNLKTILRR